MATINNANNQSLNLVQSNSKNSSF